MISTWRGFFFMSLLALFNSSKLHVRSKIFSISGGSSGSVSTGRSSSTNLSPTEFPAGSGFNKTSSFKVVSESLVYDGWRKVNRKQILLPNNKTAAFDVVTQNSPSITVFIWDRESSTATLVQEYHPGVEKMMYGAVAGMFEGHKHATILDCAKDELEEEAQLASDNWIPLLHDASAAIPFEKYSNNTLYPFLALDCRPVLNPKPADDEEFITVHRNVSHSQLVKMINSGELNIISSFTVLLGIRKLVELGIPLEKEL
jgi:hypothetical protein